MSQAPAPPVAARWFQTRPAHDSAITRISEPHVHRLLRANFRHVRGSERDLVIDGGLGVRATREALPWLFERDGVLFSGDALYDGALLDTLPGSDVGAYLSTIRALSTLDVRVVHAGHNDSFGRERLRALCDAYLARRR